MSEVMDAKGAVLTVYDNSIFLVDQLDLRLPEIGVGSHGTVWDLKVWLYKNGTAVSRNLAGGRISQNLVGAPLHSRLSIVDKLHQRFKTLIAQGQSHNYIKALLICTSGFIRWVDKYASKPLSLDTAEQSFLEWSEHLWHRAQIKKDLKKDTAYEQAASLAGVLSHALGLQVDKRPGSKNPLMVKTRLRREKKSSLKTDKSNLTDSAAFGRFLVQLCTAFTAEAIRGPLPFALHLPNGVKRHWPQNMAVETKNMSKENASTALKSRLALNPKDVVRNHGSRAAMANLRIQSELVIFIAQSGMNLSQALRLQRTRMRWKSDEGEVLAFRVFKDRREGEALFRTFKEYRRWLNVYLTWLDEIVPDDVRLFPFIGNSVVPPIGKLRWSETFKNLCQVAEVPYFNLREIRKVRQNWLLRLTGSPELTATMGAHAKRTLLLKYEKPHHQSASARITLYHSQFDPSLAAGPGACSASEHIATPESDIPQSAPKPDCISPDGCLFCIHHRDVLDLDYAWKLASHAYLKRLERDSYERPMKAGGDMHPADIVIDRIADKLAALEEVNKDFAAKVAEAKSRVWEGRYHARWSGFIELWEVRN